MTDKHLLNVTKLAASTENTPELEAYWEKRYNELLERGLFSLSTKTIDILSTTEQLDKPATPFGDLILLKHLDRNQNIDEISLQTTIETAVRLLDAILDKASFTPDSKYIVNQYRKIGVGFADFKEYLQARKATSELDEIDYIGNLVSSNAYRASESLAEEKGICVNWDKIKKHLRPKSFEYWYDVETGEIKSGLEMTDEYDQASVKQSNFEIVPRRNSNILLFSPDLEWQIWSDRDSSAPKTEINYLPKEEIRTENSEEDQAINENTPELVEPVADNTEPVLKEELPQTETILEKQEEIASFETLLTGNDQVDEDKELLVENNSFENTSGDNFQNESSLPTVELSDNVESGEALAENTSPEIISEEVLEPEEVSQIKEVAEIEPAIEPLNTIETPELNLSQDLVENKTSEPAFQIGELVQINNQEKSDHTKVYQVIDIKESPDAVFSYTLTGGHDSLESESWSESELIPVELITILDKINLPPQIVEPVIEIKEDVKNQVHAVIINNNLLLLEQTELGLELPGGLLMKNKTPEEAITEILFEKYGFNSQVLYEIGTSITASKNELPSILHLGYTIESKIPEDTDLIWLDLSEINTAEKYVQQLISKLNSQNTYFSEILTPQVSLQKQFSQPESAESKVINNFSNNFKIINSNNKNMSKYALKLEQLVKTNAFGDVIVTLQYDGTGPKLVSASSDSLDPELRHLLDTVLGLVNFTLSKNIAPSELASQLEIEPKGGVHLPINDLLKVIAASLKEAPESVEQINPNNLLEVLPEMVKEYTENSGVINSDENDQSFEEMEERPEVKTTESETTHAQQNKGFFGNFGN